MNITIPSSLKKEGKKFWKGVLSEYDVSDSQGLQYLKRAAESLDLIAECQGIIKKDGFVVKGVRGNMTAHPLLSVIRDCNSAFLQNMKQLGIDYEPVGLVGRPGGR